MQYGAELLAYQRSARLQKDTNKRLLDSKRILKGIVYFLGSLLISRVILLNYMAPFGIAALIAIVICKEDKMPLVAGFGTLIGYVSLYNNVKNLGAYITVVGTITLLSYVINNKSKKKQLLLMFVIILIEFSMYKFFVSKLTLGVASFTSFFEVTCIFPIYFIINYSIICFNDIKTRHLFNNEEVISMAVTSSLIISGTWGLSLYGISFRNIFALAFILLVSYIKGSSVGAASGVAMGVIVGIASNNMILFISVYGLCGLIAGVFKESGKVLTALSFVIAFFIINIYSDSTLNFKVIEVGISALTFLLIPKKIFNRLELELDFNKKLQHINDNYGDKVKNILIGRLDNFTDVLFNMSEVLENLADNDKLAMKNKSSALVENLADRVCSNCNMNSMCWKRESFYTYSAFSELIQNYQEKRHAVPHEIERKCTKRTALIKSTEDIVNNYIISEMWRTRLSEGRELLAGQITNMANSVGEIIEEFNTNIRFNTEAENDVRRILDKKRIKYTDILCFNDKNNRLVLKLSMMACGGRQMCVKELLPALNEVLERSMCISDEGCSINPKDGSCAVTFEETPRYHVASHVARMCKEGQKTNGDSYTFGKLNDGSYMTIISDGMGSGPQAEQESTAAVELIEKFTRAGFNKTTAINTVNSIMSLKFSSDEKFSTVDLNSIDLYSGEVDFMKVGAVASFIKSGNKVEVIKSRTLPIGVLDKVDIETIQKKVKNGDIIVMVSDGVLDYDTEVAGRTDWVTDYLEDSNCNNPKELAEELVNTAKKLSGDKVKDDMTVIVSKVYSLY